MNRYIFIIDSIFVGNYMHHTKHNKYANLSGHNKNYLFVYVAWNHAQANLSYYGRTIIHITKTRLFKYIENFTSKNWKCLGIKKSDIFSISAQNIDCGYSLEPPRRGGSNEYPQSMF